MEEKGCVKETNFRANVFLLSVIQLFFPLLCLLMAYSVGLGWWTIAPFLRLVYGWSSILKRLNEKMVHDSLCSGMQVKLPREWLFITLYLLESSLTLLWAGGRVRWSPEVPCSLNYPVITFCGSYCCGLLHPYWNFSSVCCSQFGKVSNKLVRRG